MKPHLQRSFDGLLFIVSCCPLINHLKFSGGSPGPAPPAVWPNAFIATNQPLGRGADTLVTVSVTRRLIVRPTRGSRLIPRGGVLPGTVSEPDPLASG